MLSVSPKSSSPLFSAVLLSEADLWGFLIILLSLGISEKKVINIISRNFYEYYSNEVYMLKEDLSVLSLYHRLLMETFVPPSEGF